LAVIAVLSDFLYIIILQTKYKKIETHRYYLKFINKSSVIVYGVGSDLTREGGSIPVTITIQEATNSSVMLLPLGQADDGAHSQNEKMSLRNYIDGVSIFFNHGILNKNK